MKNLHLINKTKENKAEKRKDDVKLSRLSQFVVMGRVTVTVFQFLLLLLLLPFSPLTQACPVPCQCSAVPGGGARVLCPPGQTSLPGGLDPNTTSLILAGRPVPQGGNNIPSLRHSQLTSLPALEELTLTFAHLQDLQEDALSSLRHLKRLNLHDNQVSLLTPRTFSGLDKLDLLDLTNNEDCVIQGDVFKPLTSLSTLYLGGMGLKEVRSLWFKSLSNLQNLDLHGNHIDSLEAEFLQGLLKMKMLDLTGNQLQTVPPSLQPTLTSLPSLYLADNPWHCNCELRWFKQFRRPHHSSDLLVCVTPQPLAFREVAKVPDGEMMCLPPKIIQCGGPYDVNTGSDVIMECDVEGDPFPKVTWRTPGGSVADTSLPGPFTSPHRTVNTSAVSAADFAGHHGRWNVTVSSSQGSLSTEIIVHVFTTTTTTTTTTTFKTVQQELTTTDAPEQEDAPKAVLTPSIWFYLALAAFGLTALALVALILVAAFKVRKNQRQIAQDQHDSALSLGSPAHTNLSMFSTPSSDFRAHAF